MKRLLLNTNIILDIALKRAPHFEHSSRIFELIDKKPSSLAIGDATGILIPHLHKTNKKKNYTVVPFFGEYSGMAVRLDL